MVTLLVVALLIFGPDKLPAVAKDAAQMLRTVRNMAKDARSQIKTELGPEFTDFDLDSLNPRSFVRKHLLEGEDDDLLGLRDDPPLRSTSTSADPASPPSSVPANETKPATFDPDAT
jgi:sec-independent protein translocase protein TatB